MEEQLSFPIKDIQFEKSKKEKQEEIERKFLIDSLPEEIKEELKKSSPEEIRQGYIALEEDGVEVRIRQKGDNFYQTIKSGEKGQRKEIEIEIT
jgi:CYTH domain-containing protein